MEVLKLCFQHPFATLFFLVGISTIINSIKGSSEPEKKSKTRDGAMLTHTDEPLPFPKTKRKLMN